MDDDEKEMIAEARVRLANIKGKKAKRLAREKVLDEARRLAQLQKFRELKSAGIDFVIERKRRKKKHEFNYEDEVPLERKPLEAVFSTKAEQLEKRADLNLANISINQLEGRRRDEEELQKRREDLRRVKKLRETDLPSRIRRANALNPMNFVKKRSLELEKPQLRDEDIDELAKLAKRAGDSGRGPSGLKRVRRPTDFLLQENCMDEISTIVGQAVTPSSGGALMARAREVLEVSDPDYVSHQAPGAAPPKDDQSVSSYFTSGLSVKGGAGGGQMDLGQFDKTGAKKTPNPFRQLVESLKHDAGDFAASKKEAESVYSVQSASVVSKLNDHLSINSPWANGKKIDTDAAPAEPSNFQRTRAEWSHLSQKKQRRKLAALVQAEFDRLPERGTDFELDYSELAGEFEAERRAEGGNSAAEAPEKVRIREEEPGFASRAQRDRRICAEALQALVGPDERAALRERLRALQTRSDAESRLERRSLAMAAEDLEDSALSEADSGDEDVPPECFENAEALLAREGEAAETPGVVAALEARLFDEEYFAQKGFDRVLLEKRLRMERRQELAKELERQSRARAQREKSALHFEEVGVTKEARKVFEAEKKALVLGRMDGLEKAHCLRELRRMEAAYERLKAVEAELQEQFEKAQMRQQL